MRKEQNGFRSGFVSVLGSPNVGKSTLINHLVGQKVSIVSEKPQTTRNAIRGIATRPAYQMVFIDTPGLMEPRNRLGETMVRAAKGSARDVDVLLFVASAAAGVKKRDCESLVWLKGTGVPLVAAVNKTDIAGPESVRRAVEALEEAGIDKIAAVSALSGEGMDALEALLASLLPEGPKYYPDEMYTDQPERFIAAELIREKALALLSEEVPHGVGVEIEKIEKREAGLFYVAATIYCERRTHKGIIIGAGGSMIKRIGSEARADLQLLFGNRVYLELFVKVREDWRNSKSVLKTLGYE